MFLSVNMPLTMMDMFFPSAAPSSSSNESPISDAATTSPTAAQTPTPTGSIRGTVFEDVNNNGEQDPGEPTIEGVDVVITDSECNTLTLTTDAAGMYMAEVPIGNTVIDIDESTLASGFEQTVGTDPTTVNDPYGGTASDLDGYFFPSTAPSSSPSESPSEALTTSPTALQTPTPTGIVRGTVFEDVNKNGEQGPGESAIKGVDVVMTDSVGNTLTLTTDAAGTIGDTVIDIDESTLASGFEQTVGTDPTIVNVLAFRRNRNGS
jgi:hypothetical protein